MALGQYYGGQRATLRGRALSEIDVISLYRSRCELKRNFVQPGEPVWQFPLSNRKKGAEWESY